MPEHRQWMLSFPPEYLLGLLRLSLMIPFMTLCFLKSVRLPSSPAVQAVTDGTGSVIRRSEHGAHCRVFFCICRRPSNTWYRRVPFVSTQVHGRTYLVLSSAHHCAYPSSDYRHQSRNPHAIESGSPSGQEPVGGLHRSSRRLLYRRGSIPPPRTCAATSHHYSDRRCEGPA
jgi:hypothetical protein